MPLIEAMGLDIGDGDPYRHIIDARLGKSRPNGDE
jgi:hypothetical protein